MFAVPKRRDKVGLWIVGACGGVGATVALGLAALRKGLAPSTGLVTDLPPFHTAGLIDPASVVLGGHEIRAETLEEAVRAIHNRAKLFDADLIRRSNPQLRAWQRWIRPGTVYGASPIVRELADRGDRAVHQSAADAVEALTADLDEFRRENRLDDVVVVYLGASEPPPRQHAGRENYATLQRAMARTGSSVLPPSSIYALAAIEAGFPFINFTPSLGVSVPAIRQRATELGVPFMGNDGKTGESLVKSVLAPMFAMRHLHVLSWFGQNILGNRDGAILSDPRTRLSKIRSKGKVVSAVTGTSSETGVAIDYVPSLDDWKVAWDYVHFEGFLGTKMSLQFIWQGSDSALAAPLVIDLARLAVREHRAGRAGPMRHLAFFFKDPIDVVEHNLFVQWQRLVEHVTGVEPQS